MKGRKHFFSLGIEFMFFFFFLNGLFFFAVLGLELRAYTLSYSSSPIFVKDVFEIGLCELFAWAVFEP
jgi:hypothetical protein